MPDIDRIRRSLVALCIQGGEEGRRARNALHAMDLAHGEALARAHGEALARPPAKQIPAPAKTKVQPVAKSKHLAKAEELFQALGEEGAMAYVRQQVTELKQSFAGDGYAPSPPHSAPARKTWGSEEDRRGLRMRMGLPSGLEPIRTVGTTRIFSAITPSEAQARLAKQNGR